MVTKMTHSNDSRRLILRSRRSWTRASATASRGLTATAGGPAGKSVMH